MLKRRIGGQGVKCDVSVLADDSTVINIPTSEPFASLSELVLCVIPQDPSILCCPRVLERSGRSVLIVITIKHMLIDRSINVPLEVGARFSVFYSNHDSGSE
jgi:hypothetical protein